MKSAAENNKDLTQVVQIIIVFYMHRQLMD